MVLSAKTRLPWAIKPQKPGRGLSQILQQDPPNRPTLPPPNEPPTARLPVIPEAPTPTTCLCPVCSGAGELHVTPYARSFCTECDASGYVPKDQFDKYISDHPESYAARKLAKNKTTT